MRSSMNLAVFTAIRFLSSIIVSLYTFIKALNIASARETLLPTQVICTIVVPLPAKEVEIPPL